MDTTLNVAWAIVPLIIVAQCFSWYGVLTTNYLANAIENSIWAVAFLLVGIGLCRLLPEFDGLVRLALIVATGGIAAYLAFLITIDVPMYLNRWQDGLADGRKVLGTFEGLRDASTRWVVTHDFAQWKDEIAWMSLYFTAAVWASLALCLAYSLGDHLPQYRTEPAAQVLSFAREHHTRIEAHDAHPVYRVVQASLPRLPMLAAATTALAGTSLVTIAPARSPRRCRRSYRPE